MTEQQVQAKILKHLIEAGYYTVKTITVNRAGVPDILACDPKGRFWGIEVKTETGRASKLQEVNIRKITEAGGVAFICWGWDDFLIKYNNRTLV